MSAGYEPEGPVVDGEEVLTGRNACCGGFQQHLPYCPTKADRIAALRQCQRDQRDARRQAEARDAAYEARRQAALDAAERYSGSVGAGASFMERSA